MAKKDDKPEARETKHDRVARTLRALNELPEALDDLERAGDHDHGFAAIPKGGPCAGGDCIVAKARAVLAALGIKEL